MTAILHQHNAMPTAQLLTHPMLHSLDGLPINGCQLRLLISQAVLQQAVTSFSFNVHNRISK